MSIAIGKIAQITNFDRDQEMLFAFGDKGVYLDEDEVKQLYDHLKTQLGIKDPVPVIREPLSDSDVLRKVRQAHEDEAARLYNYDDAIRSEISVALSRVAEKL